MLIEMKDKHVLNLTSDPVCRLPLVRDILPQYLMARRWYASKEDTAPSVTIEECCRCSRFRRRASFCCWASKLKNGDNEQLFFPDPDNLGMRAARTGVVCELRAGPAAGWLVDGFSDDGFVRALLEGIQQADGNPE